MPQWTRRTSSLNALNSTSSTPLGSKNNSATNSVNSVESASDSASTNHNSNQNSQTTSSGATGPNEDAVEPSTAGSPLPSKSCAKKSKKHRPPPINLQPESSANSHRNFKSAKSKLYVKTPTKEDFRNGFKNFADRMRPASMSPRSPRDPLKSPTIKSPKSPLSPLLSKCPLNSRRNSLPIIPVTPPPATKIAPLKENEIFDIPLATIERDGLLKLLGSKVALTYFLSYLLINYNMENLFFILDVNSYFLSVASIIPSTEISSYNLSRHIHETYLSPGAILELNIPSTIRRQSLEYYSQKEYTKAFKKARKAVLEMLESAFTGFKKHEFYTSLFTTIGKSNYIIKDRNDAIVALFQTLNAKYPVSSTDLSNESSQTLQNPTPTSESNETLNFDQTSELNQLIRTKTYHFVKHVCGVKELTDLPKEVLKVMDPSMVTSTESSPLLGVAARKNSVGLTNKFSIKDLGKEFKRRFSTTG